jgi:hypothetical protein
MVWGKGPTSFFYMYKSSWSGPIYCKTILSPLNGLDTLIKKSIDHRCLGLFLDFQFYSISVYVYPYASITLFHSFKSECHILRLSFLIRKCEYSNFVLLFEPVFSVEDFLQFHMHLRIIFPICTKMVLKNYDRNCIESVNIE